MAFEVGNISESQLKAAHEYLTMGYVSELNQVNSELILHHKNVSDAPACLRSQKASARVAMATCCIDMAGWAGGSAADVDGRCDSVQEVQQQLRSCDSDVRTATTGSNGELEVAACAANWMCQANEGARM